MYPHRFESSIWSLDFGASYAQEVNLVWKIRLKITSIQIHGKDCLEIFAGRNDYIWFSFRLKYANDDWLEFDILMNSRSIIVLYIFMFARSFWIDWNLEPDVDILLYKIKLLGELNRRFRR